MRLAIKALSQRNGRTAGSFNGLTAANLMAAIFMVGVVMFLGPAPDAMADDANGFAALGLTNANFENVSFWAGPYVKTVAMVLVVATLAALAYGLCSRQRPVEAPIKR